MILGCLDRLWAWAVTDLLVRDSNEAEGQQKLPSLKDENEQQGGWLAGHGLRIAAGSPRGSSGGCGDFIGADAADVEGVESWIAGGFPC